MLAPQITTNTGKTGIPGSLCKAMGPEVSLAKAMANIAKAAISLHKATDPQGPTPGHLQGGQPMSLQRLPLKKMSCNICIGAKGPKWKELLEEPC